MNTYVRVIIQNEKKDILMLKKHKAEHECQWNYPGGKVEKGETLIDAAIREIKEETNLDINQLTLLHTLKVPYKNEFWTGYYYLAQNVTGTLLNNEPHLHEIVQYYSLDYIIKQIGPRLIMMTPLMFLYNR